MRESTGSAPATATSCRTLRRRIIVGWTLLIVRIVLSHSGLTPEAFTTFAHFSVSAARCAPNSVGVYSMGAVPTSASLGIERAIEPLDNLGRRAGRNPDAKPRRGLIARN